MIQNKGWIGYEFKDNSIITMPFILRVFIIIKLTLNNGHLTPSNI
jgi:hypothetical protein